MIHDGKDHINVYSKGETKLGRMLSNFAYTPFILPIAGRFDSVEAFWHWWRSGGRTNKRLHGFQASNQKYVIERDPPSPELLKRVYLRKLKYQTPLKEALMKSTLPFTHYYVYGGLRKATPWEWTGSLWHDIREELKYEQSLSKI